MLLQITGSPTFKVINSLSSVYMTLSFPRSWLPHAIHLCWSAQFFQVEMIEIGLLDSILHNWGEAGHSRCSRFPHQAGSLLALELSHFGRKVSVTVQCFCYQTFCSTGGLGPLFWTSKFPQRHSHPGVVVKVMFLWKEVELVCHLANWHHCLVGFGWCALTSSVAHTAGSELTPLSSSFSYPVSPLSHFHFHFFILFYFKFFIFKF